MKKIIVSAFLCLLLVATVAVALATPAQAYITDECQNFSDNVVVGSHQSVIAAIACYESMPEFFW